MVNTQLQIRRCDICGAPTLQNECLCVIVFDRHTRRLVQRMAMDNVRLTEALPVRCHTVKTFFRH